MVVALLSSTYAVALEHIKKSNDKIDLVGGASLYEFLTETRERNEFFTRLVVVESSLRKGMEEEDLAFLHDYIQNYSSSTEVVFAVPRASGSELMETFVNYFNAPMYTGVYLPEKITVDVLKKLVGHAVLELKATYYSLDKEEVKAKQVAQKAKKEEDTTKEAPKKKGFLASLSSWGKKPTHEEKKEEPKKEDTPKEEVSETVHLSANGGLDVSLPPVGTKATQAVPQYDVLEEGVATVATTASAAQPLIDSLFGGGTSTETAFDDEDDEDLNFGSFGDAHFQTGIIAEDDEEEEDLPETTSSVWQSVTGSSSTPTPGWGSLNSTEPTPSPRPYEPQKADLTAFNFQYDKNTTVFVIGSVSSEFLASYAQQFSPDLILDTKTTDNMVEHIDHSQYLVRGSSPYFENGVEYQLDVPLHEVPSRVASRVGLTLVNVEVQDLPSLLRTFTSPFKVLSVFPTDIDGFKTQLLNLEKVSPTLSTELSKGDAYVLGGMRPDLRTLLDTAVFNKISWRRVFA